MIKELNMKYSYAEDTNITYKCPFRGVTGNK